MPYIDFAELKARVSIEEAASRLRLTLTKSGAQFRSACPACKSGGPRALVVTPAKSLFYCFAAEKGGDQISLTAHVRECSVQEAAAWLGGTSTVTNTSASNGTSTVRKNHATEPPAREKAANKPGANPAGFPPLDYLDPDHDAVVASGLDADTARFIGAGYAPKGVLRGTVAIPIRDEGGMLLGYVGVHEVLLPPKGLVPQTNIVQLKRA